MTKHAKNMIAVSMINEADRPSAVQCGNEEWSLQGSLRWSDQHSRILNRYTRARNQWCPKMNHFTIVELLVGMSILSILMLMMFRFVISAQRMLDISDSTWGIYENSRVVFDLIERDLQSAVASSIGGDEISFYI